ncbi:cAMP-binding domain of CRP or a regulatory subunit of cAMP-dependent protein kinases [Chitinophaga ginsengisegetis]|uniref:cAMP-binding domain of CRP or a regulatory subunit of cAMP-dependent protein kinases n=1 Tax=Chitinophaga ginsengisegetis TaxID=393003 RepID=A0A1T5NXD1_9BACT|nr:Crp/Fnr family transcriptional regulator [Chitinophaga ginsengisegetis]SKD04768.1 cAMP-binding domain of CRP or a regulatory subunit of cAMP-dependent protein kinases [Chitinophaga ginsengisegetis]
MKKAGTCDLNTCFLCQYSIPEWIAAVSDHRQHLFYKKNETIFQEGSPVKGIFFLYDGKVKVHKQWGAEKELIVRFAQKGDILGHRGLGSGDRLYTVSATALEDTTVCYTELSFFEASLKVNPSLALKLMQFYADELQEAERKMRNLVHMDVKGRLADALLELSRLHKALHFTISRQDLAAFAGTTYETIYRNLQEFIAEKLITAEGRAITILNEKKLRRYIVGG